MIRSVIIDDEPEVASGIHKLVENFCEEIKVQGLAHTAEEGIELIRKTRPHLIFLDILMPRNDGFYLLEEFRPHYGFQCVFVTAHEEFALKAIKYNALDYLLKPVDPDELRDVVNKIRRKLERENTDPGYGKRLENLLNNAENKRIALPNAKGIDWLKVSEIVFVHAEGNYCHLWLQSGAKLLVTRRLKYFEEELGGEQFMRIHKSYVINLLKVKGYTRSFGGMIIMENGGELPVSDKYKPGILRLMGLA